LLNDGVAEDVESVLSRMPKGADTDLIRQAIANEMHVFLTRDKGILRNAPALRQFGLLGASPHQLAELLEDCGVTPFSGGARLHGGCPYSGGLPVNDLQRMSHLIEALGT
jgi:hypothetical protein